MATIRRHPVPPDSFQPDAPLNDLGREQLKHFVHVAERLPPELRVDMPIPSPEDGHAANRFIAAVTERLLSRKPPALKIVAKRRRKPASTGISMAAGAEEVHSQRAKSKSKSKSESKARKHSSKKSPRE
jgi:hypothetical protein